MVDNIKLLDCTLRDGGYINGWNFGKVAIKNIIKDLVESQVDYIEVGFLRDCVYDEDKTVFNNCEEIKNIIPLKRGNTKFSAMALHNKYDITKLEPYDGKTIDFLRVTFHDYDIDEGLQFIKNAIDKGYRVFCNPINIMGYTDVQIIELINKVNEIHPYAFSIVDTFGSMMKTDLMRIYTLLEHNLDTSICIGLHLHENLAMSYSLAQDFLAMKSIYRSGIIDGSLLGMGRVPGNLCIELIMNYVNRYLGGNYNTDPVLDAIDDYIVEIKKNEPWGYSTAYALSAKYNLHRNYAEFLLNKGNLRTKQINQLLSRIDDDKKTAFDEDYIKGIYAGYQNISINDEVVLNEISNKIRGRSILILAPGASVKEYKKQIVKAIEKKGLFVISVNFRSSIIESNLRFFSNAVRYENYDLQATDLECIITSNLMHLKTCSSNVVNYSDLAFEDNCTFDNAVIMLLRLLDKIGCKEIYLAGVDGYLGKINNYAETYMYSKTTENDAINLEIKKYINIMQERMNIQFITPSLYDVKNPGGIRRKRGNLSEGIQP